MPTSRLLLKSYNISKISWEKCKKEKTQYLHSFLETFFKIRTKDLNQHKNLRFFIHNLDVFREKKFGHQMSKKRSIFTHFAESKTLFFVNIYQSLLDSHKDLNIEASSRVP
jgi:hypothetical protein